MQGEVLGKNPVKLLKNSLTTNVISLIFTPHTYKTPIDRNS